MPNSTLRAIAFYLPQFHPIPENDEWWGQGFTEWRNVSKAKPLFPGHYQPHLPADLGFYDLRLPEVREAQAELARQHGIHGFCYYHYWFNGRRILERPFNDVLASGKPDFPFCLCWANENWTRVWDGGSRHILLEQRYSEEDDRNHIQHLIPALRDPRYIRINGRPLLLIYRTELLPDPSRTADIWREAAHKAGLGDLYLARVENFTDGIDPAGIGFDAAIEFCPNPRHLGKRVFFGPITHRLSKANILPKAHSMHAVFRYSAVAEAKKHLPAPPYKQMRGVTPMWDNTARCKANGRILVGSTPALYKDWLSTVVKQTCERLEGEERIVFINAWNEWAEGCHLEPDLRWGRAYLEATYEALVQTRSVNAPTTRSAAGIAMKSRFWSLRAKYWQWARRARDLEEIGRMVMRLPAREAPRS